MVPEAVQAATEVAKQSGSITVAIPLAGLTGLLSAAIFKGLEILLSRSRHSRQPKVEEKPEEKIPKPGDGQKCQEHGQEIAALKAIFTQVDKKLDLILEAHMPRRSGE